MDKKVVDIAKDVAQEFNDYVGELGESPHNIRIIVEFFVLKVAELRRELSVLKGGK